LLQEKFKQEKWLHCLWCERIKVFYELSTWALMA